MVRYDRLLMQASAGQLTNTPRNLIGSIAAQGWISVQRTEHPYDAVALFALPAGP